MVQGIKDISAASIVQRKTIIGMVMDLRQLTLADAAGIRTPAPKRAECTLSS